MQSDLPSMSGTPGTSHQDASYRYTHNFSPSIVNRHRIFKHSGQSEWIQRYFGEEARDLPTNNPILELEINIRSEATATFNLQPATCNRGPSLTASLWSHLADAP